MSLAVVVDSLADRLEAATTATASDQSPSAMADLPHITITIDDAVQPMIGIGETPRGTRTGSLSVTAEIDLADPTLDFGDDTVDLVSEDRLTFVIPNGPVVRPEEVTVSDDGGPYELVDGDPTGRQVAVDRDLGELTFGQALPSTGTLEVELFIGMWDVTVVRYSGIVALDLRDTTPPAVAALSRSTADELGRPDGAFERLVPTTWGAVAGVNVGRREAHSQTLRYRFDFELEQPSLPTGGGVIRTVEVTSATDGTTEEYDVTHEGSGA